MDISTATNLGESLNALQNDAPIAGGQLAALEAQLKKLYQSESKIGEDASLDAKTRKVIMGGLQADIQMVMQRIANLKSGNKKRPAPITEGAVPTKIDKNQKEFGATDVTQAPAQKYKVDISV